jgi:hypothetical protein
MAVMRSDESHVRVHESPIHGRVLEVKWTRYPADEGSAWGASVLSSLVEGHQPRCLVVDLRRFDPSFGMPLFSALVGGAAAMHRLGGDRRTRVLAVGSTRTKLQQFLVLSRLAELFGGDVFSDLDAALADPR